MVVNLLQLIDRALTSAMLAEADNQCEEASDEPTPSHGDNSTIRQARVLNVVVMPAITERIENEIAKFENNLHRMMLMFLIICQCKIIYTFK